jgi:hypothetical protein
MSALQEDLPRRPCMATFAEAPLVLKLIPGAQGRGAVVAGWTDPIRKHDEVVLLVEEGLELEKRLAREFKSAERVATNWSVAYGLINDDPTALEAYRKLKHEMRNYEERFSLMEPSPAKVLLQAEWQRYCSIRPKFERVIAAEKELDRCKAARDAAQSALLVHSRSVAQLRSKERAVAATITDDHIVAAERNQVRTRSSMH